jgi:hypothetical protein
LLGVRLSSAVSVVEPTAAGPKVTSLHPAAVDSNRHTGSNMARGLAYAGQHNTVELAGVSSSTPVPTTMPAFYIHIDTEDPNDQHAGYVLLKLKPQKDTRLVLNLTANTFGGGRKRKMEEVAVTKTDVSPGWMKMTPQTALPPGEYGIMFLPKDTNMFTDRVYDFTIVAP